LNFNYLKKILSKENISQNLLLYSFIVLAFFLPFYNKPVSYIIIFLCVPAWLYQVGAKIKTKKIINPSVFIIILLYYLVHVAGLLYSHNFKTGLFDLEVKLSVLVFPLMLAFSEKSVPDKYNDVLLGFVIGNVVSSFVCLLIALIKSIAAGSIYYYVVNELGIFRECLFFYKALSSFHHPTYSAMYLTFSIVILFYLLKYKVYNFSKKINFILYSLIVFFSVMIFLLSSKSGIIISFIALFGMISIEILRFKKYIPTFFWLLTIIVCFTFAIKYNSRFSSLTTKQKNEKLQNTESTEVRYQILEASISIVKRNLIFGVGTGDIKDSLLDNYKKRNISWAFSNKFNVHNQFIETFVGQGIIGFILLLLLFSLPLISGIQKSNFILLFFIIVTGLNFLTESMLNTQAGVVFFAFFYSVLNFKSYANTIFRQNEKIY
jgi:O-antigen ligase